jgi:hypothetical protein
VRFNSPEEREEPPPKKLTTSFLQKQIENFLKFKEKKREKQDLYYIATKKKTDGSCSNVRGATSFAATRLAVFL